MVPGKKGWNGEGIFKPSASLTLQLMMGLSNTGEKLSLFWAPKEPM